jgi:predicted dehydrogenase
VSQHRYDPGVLAAKKLLEDGRLGKPLFVQVRVPWYRTQGYYDSADWRGTWALDGGGALMNQSVHYADLLSWLFGPSEVLASHCATLAHDIEVEDLALAFLRFDTGVLASFVASTLSYPGEPATLSINGTRGSLELENGGLVRLQLEEGKPGLEELEGEDLSALAMPDGHRAQLADTISTLREGLPAPVSGEDGYRALKLVLDVYRSADWHAPHP